MQTQTRLPTAPTILRRGFTDNADFSAHASELDLIAPAGGIHPLKGFHTPDNGVRIMRRIEDRYVRRIVGAQHPGFLLKEVPYGDRALYAASGHLDNFHDPAVRCRGCGTRHRVDHLIEAASGMDCAGLDLKNLGAALKEYDLHCPACGGEFAEPRERSLMVTCDIAGDEFFLPPETAQHIFLHYEDGLRQNRHELPFSLHQIGLAARAEVTPDLRRRLLFTQVEEEFFFDPAQLPTEQAQAAKVRQYVNFFTHDLGIRPEQLRLRAHSPSELSHYSSATTDIELKVAGRWLEVAGIADRGQFDLSNMERLAGRPLRRAPGHETLPHVIEPSVGLDRLFLAVIDSAFRVEEVNGRERIVLGLHPGIAPFDALVTALQPRDPAQAAISQRLYRELRGHFDVLFDATRSIGRRYRRADRIGVPWAVTVDPQTVLDGTVTLRERDSMAQQRVPINEVRHRLMDGVAC